MSTLCLTFESCAKKQGLAKMNRGNRRNHSPAGPTIGHPVPLFLIFQILQHGSALHRGGFILVKSSPKNLKFIGRMTYNFGFSVHLLPLVFPHLFIHVSYMQSDETHVSTRVLLWNPHIVIMLNYIDSNFMSSCFGQHILGIVLPRC